jgi:hypothetical protein
MNPRRGLNEASARPLKRDRTHDMFIMEQLFSAVLR